MMLNATRYIEAQISILMNNKNIPIDFNQFQSDSNKWNRMGPISTDVNQPKQCLFSLGYNLKPSQCATAATLATLWFFPVSRK